MRTFAKYTKRTLIASTCLASAFCMDLTFHQQPYADTVTANSGSTQTDGILFTILPGESPIKKAKKIWRKPGQFFKLKAPRAPKGKVFSHWRGPRELMRGHRVAIQFIRVKPTSETSFTFTPVYKVPSKINRTARDAVQITIAGQGTQTVRPGQKFVLIAPKLEGFEFKRWNGNIGLLSNATKRRQKFVIPNRDISFRAVYKPKKSVENNPENVPTITETPPAAPTPPVAETPPAAPEPSFQPPEPKVVKMLSHSYGETIDRQGEVIVGKVMHPQPDMTVSVAVGSRVSEVDVEEATGNFIVKLDPSDLAQRQITVRFTTNSVTGAQKTDKVMLRVADDVTGITNILSRVTFGATPGLIEYFSTGEKEEKFREYITQQLSPESIDDSAFEEMNVDRFLGRQIQYKEVKPWRIAYSTYSQRQLREVMTQFWDNHFLSAPSAVDFVGDIMEVNGFRKHAFGSFRELLRVSSTSPTMLMYLNNHQSRASKINENYSRELLELHTVGIDGGYGADDIIEVARVMTGWGRKKTPGFYFGQSQETSRNLFEFVPARHDSDDKYIPFLDMTIKGRDGMDGMQEGEELLDVLASHPSTQRFICKKLIQRFVSDDPPVDFMDACVAAWQRTDGNIGEVLKAILLHPDYQSNVSLQRNKIKTPYEYFISVLRNFAIYPTRYEEFDSKFTKQFYATIVHAMLAAGFRWDGTPDGVSETAEDWVSTGAMLTNYNGFIDLIKPKRARNGSLIKNKLTDIDYRLFLNNADVKTAEGVAIYLLEMATAGRYKADELDKVVTALKGSDNIFDHNNPETLEADVRRAMTVIATLPNTYIQ